MKCSNKELGCLDSLNEKDAITLISTCLAELNNMRNVEKKQYMSAKVHFLYLFSLLTYRVMFCLCCCFCNKVAGCITGYTPGLYTKATWKVGKGLHVLSGVCRQCFLHCYECSHGYLDQICASIKSGEDASVPQLNDTTPAYEYSATFKKALNQMANKDNIMLDHVMIAALQIPNTIQSLSCYAWMSSFFKLVGDSQPNKNEIHIEPTEIKEIHSEVTLLVQIFVLFIIDTTLLVRSLHEIVETGYCDSASIWQTMDILFFVCQNSGGKGSYWQVYNMCSFVPH